MSSELNCVDLEQQHHVSHVTKSSMASVSRTFKVTMNTPVPEDAERVDFDDDLDVACSKTMVVRDAEQNMLDKDLEFELEMADEQIAGIYPELLRRGAVPEEVVC